jgi:hypothetical protein
LSITAHQAQGSALAAASLGGCLRVC